VHVLLLFLSEWRELRSAPCVEEKKIDFSSMLEVVEIVLFTFHKASAWV
jgi:hypothetical protein